jgi:hypothetical protein
LANLPDTPEGLELNSKGNRYATLVHLGEVIMIKDDGTAGEPVPLPSGFSVVDGIEHDAKGNIFVSEILLNQIWLLSPDGSLRLLIATKQDAPLDNNTSLVLRGDVLCTANLGYAHAKLEEADRTAVCTKGFPLPN